MKKSLLFFTFVLTSVFAPVKAQQTNVYSVCTNYQENYIPGYYDRYGNYVRGGVNTQAYNVQCGTGTYYRPNTTVVYQEPVSRTVVEPRPYYPRRYCSPARTTLGGLLGGGIAAAASKKNAWSWSIPLGAVLGTGVANATCY